MPAMMNEDYDYLLNILIIGNSGAGKTCLLVKFANCAFEVGQRMTLTVDHKKRLVELDGNRIMFHLVDTVGQERFQSLNTFCYRGAHGIIVAYDVTDQNSFNNLGFWLKEIDLYARDDVCKLLVGCKNDRTRARTVQYNTAKAFADHRGLQLIETSASDGTNVDEAFMTIAREIMRRSPPPLRSDLANESVRLNASPPPRRTCWFFTKLLRLFSK